MSKKLGDLLELNSAVADLQVSAFWIHSTALMYKLIS